MTRQTARSSSGSTGGSVVTGVLQLAGGVGLDTTLRNITDQLGTLSPLNLSTTQLNIGGGTSLGRLVTRGDGTNPINRFEDSTGTLFWSLNAAATIQRIGGTTSSFPAIKRNGSTIDFRLADDSAYCAVSAYDFQVFNSRYFLLGSNSSGTAGVLMSGLGQGILSLTDAGATNGITQLRFGRGSDIGIFNGTGSPEGVVTAPAGSIYLNRAGGILTSIFVKQTGTGNTNWVGIG